MSDSFQPHELQHARPLCPSPTPGACSSMIGYVYERPYKKSLINWGRLFGHFHRPMSYGKSQTTSQSNHTHHSLFNSMKLSHAVWGHPRRMGHGGEVCQSVVHWRREWQTTSVSLPWEPHEQYEKEKKKKQKNKTKKDFICSSVYIREGNGNPLQYSCLENHMDGGAWWVAVHGVTKSQTWLSNFTFTFQFHVLEKEMITYSSRSRQEHWSVLAWRIPGTGEPAGLLSMGLHRVGHDWSDLAATAACICWS